MNSSIESVSRCLADVGDPSAASAAAVVDRLLGAAADAGASDLHLEPGDEGLAVRLRLDGVLQDAGRLPAPLAGRAVTRLKVLAGLLSYRHDIPQEGRIESAAGRAALRLAVFPTVAGERAVVRLFAGGDRLGDLADLGLAGEQQAALGNLAARGEGMILLTGPAGSGKTTTIYAMLRHIITATPGRSVLALEDPVEQRVPGVSQTQVGPPGGMGFAAGLRSALRQDPQVLAVGEIRDAETATTAVAAALSGHLLISTLHAGSAPAVFARLAQIGIEPFQLASAVTAVLAQRLPRRRCGSCGGDRCDACGNVGYAGRAMLAELLVVGEATRAAVMIRGDREALAEAAIADGMVPLATAGRRMVEAGVTTTDELRRVGVL